MWFKMWNNSLFPILHEKPYWQKVCDFFLLSFPYCSIPLKFHMTFLTVNVSKKHLTMNCSLNEKNPFQFPLKFAHPQKPNFFVRVCIIHVLPVVFRWRWLAMTLKRIQTEMSSWKFWNIFLLPKMSKHSFVGVDKHINLWII